MSIESKDIRESIERIVMLCERSTNRVLRISLGVKLREQIGKFERSLKTRVRISSVCRAILKAEYTAASYNYSFLRNKVLYKHPVWVIKILSLSDEEYIPEDFTLERLAAVLECTEQCMEENVIGLSK